MHIFMDEIVFDEWNIQKKKLNSNDKSFFFKEWEIWRVSIGLNIWSEVYGKWKWFMRPVIILKKLSRHICIVIPLTSKIKEWSWYFSFSLKGNIRCVLLHQIRMIHINRYKDKIWEVSNITFLEIKKRLSLLLNLS